MKVTSINQPRDTEVALRIVMAQLDFLVGDVAANAAMIIDQTIIARYQHQADVIVFPELALVGYPPEDLLFRHGFMQQVEAAIEKIKAAVQGIDVVLGCPQQTTQGLYNAAIVIRSGEVIASYYKQCLPNHSVFDEKRYFEAGTEAATFDCKGVSIGLAICEDVWVNDSRAELSIDSKAPVQQAVDAGAQILIVINASPFCIDKPRQRDQVLSERIAESSIPILYVNMVGGQDELVFDGVSFVMDARQTVLVRGPAFEAMLVAVDVALGVESVPAITVMPGLMSDVPSELSQIYQALVLGVRDYVEKNGFEGVLIGLSGGIDSALTLTIAVDALGADQVEAVMMPSRYTATMSCEDAREECERLGVTYHEVSIEPVFEQFLADLDDLFEGKPVDTTEENLQARCRGVMLMALSNKHRKIVLAAGNKSELSVGYSTLYGDMCGGFMPIKDVPKLLVYQLARFRNRGNEVIPRRVIERAPSAELAEDQRDDDSLPPYEVLDPILALFIERDLDPSAIIKAGYDEAVVRRVVRMVMNNEYKRKQSPPGVRITSRAFGRDWRYPIASGFDESAGIDDEASIDQASE